MYKECGVSFNNVVYLLIPAFLLCSCSLYTCVARSLFVVWTWLKVCYLLIPLFSKCSFHCAALRKNSYSLLSLLSILCLWTWALAR